MAPLKYMQVLINIIGHAIFPLFLFGNVSN